MKLQLYTLAWRVATPFLLVLLLWRSRRQAGYRRGMAQRWGFGRRPAGVDGRVIWVHAVSVGETRAAQPLIQALLQEDPGVRVLLTHMTPTGRETGEELFVKRHGERVLQAWLPYDLPGATRRFLRAWRPEFGVLMETELWPNLCASAQAEGVPLALVNARLSERSLRRGRRHAALIVPALKSLAAVVAQTHADARRLRELGRHEVVVAGNMKFDIQPPLDLLERGRGWRARLGGRPVVLAASTRDGEEAPLLAAWRERADAPGALLVIVPRHPQRFDAVARLIETQGFVLSRRSGSAQRLSDASGAPDWLRADVLLGDSMGEMFAWYAMADVAVLGGSLLPFGGQNLIEACASSCPVVLGPHTFNFEDAATQAVAAQAAVRVADAGEAVGKALDLLAQDGVLAAMGARGARFAAEHRGATRRTLAALQAQELLGPAGR